jgi:integrase/recombinase XerD
VKGKMEGEERFLDYLKAKGFHANTIKNITIHLEQFELWLCAKAINDIREITPKIIQDYQVYLTKDHKRKDGQNISLLTVLARLSCLRKYFQFLQKHRLILLDPALGLELPKLRDYLPRNILTQEETEHLLALPNSTIFGLRDKAILELLYSSGLRRAELSNLDLYDINLKDKTFYIRQPKNRKDRIIPIGEKAKEAIEKYLLAARPKLSQDSQEKALFLSRYGLRIPKASLNYIIKKYSKIMRLDKRITPHCLRHSCATHLLQNGAPLAIIQRILGHTRIKTTQIYTRISPLDLKQAIKKYHPRERIKILQRRKFVV